MGFYFLLISVGVFSVRLLTRICLTLTTLYRSKIMGCQAFHIPNLFITWRFVPDVC